VGAGNVYRVVMPIRSRGRKAKREQSGKRNQKKEAASRHGVLLQQ